MPIYVIAEKLKLIDYIGYSILVSTLINMQGDGLCFHSLTRFNSPTKLATS